MLVVDNTWMLNIDFGEPRHHSITTKSGYWHLRDQQGKKFSNGICRGRSSLEVRNGGVENLDDDPIKLHGVKHHNIL